MPQPTSRPYVLGVDGGGTKTHAAIADRQGHVVRTGSGGPVNIGWVGAAVAAESTQAAIRGALEAAGVGADAVAFAYLGMASVDLDRPEDKSRPVFAAALEALGLPADRTQIDNDAVVGMAAALGPGPGACVVGGTGFNAIAVARDGSRVRVPWYVGARAAGHILGRQAAMAAFFDLIGAGPHTGLTRACSPPSRSVMHVPPRMPPVGGALALAIQRTGAPVTYDVLDRLATDLGSVERSAAGAPD